MKHWYNVTCKDNVHLYPTEVCIESACTPCTAKRVWMGSRRNGMFLFYPWHKRKQHEGYILIHSTVETGNCDVVASFASITQVFAR